MPANVNPYVQEFDSVVDCVSSPVIIRSRGSKRQVECLGIWDTGASASYITEKLSRLANLVQKGFVEVATAHDEGAEDLRLVPMFIADIQIGKLLFRGIRLGQCDRLLDDEDLGLLIGMDIISQGDLEIRTSTGRTQLRFEQNDASD